MTLPAQLLQKNHTQGQEQMNSVKHLERQYIRPLERLKFGQPILDEGQMIQSCLAREFSGRNTPADKLSRKIL